MKKLSIILSLTMFIMASCQQNAEKTAIAEQTQFPPADTTDATNYFYDNAETHELPLNEISIGGEVSNPSVVDLSGLPLHTIIVKEAVLAEDGNKFVGAYRYDGYSLLDILNNFILHKANQDEFEPIIDLYVEIENEANEKVVVSWGEIYYPNHLHEVIIAKQVMRIVPSKTNDLWPLPEKSKLVIGSDLITERNILAPSKITIKSYPRSFETIKGKKPLFSEKVDFFKNDELQFSLDQDPENMQEMHYESIFYGRGRGIHSTTPFTGTRLMDHLKTFTSITTDNIQKGLVLIVADDGYRVVYTFSEIMNRNDQSEVLLIYHGDGNGGLFRLYPAGDFFSDRAIKSIAGIYLDAEN